MQSVRVFCEVRTEILNITLMYPTGLDPRTVYVRFVVDGVALGQV
jgi:hypothetical protein